MLLALSLTLFVNACGSTTVISACSWVKPISLSKDDVLTDQTARELLQHNLKVEEICGK